MANKRPGVRGPQGPGQQPSGNSSGKPAKQPAAPVGSMSTFQRRSLPFITFLVALPRWIVVVLLGSLLLLGIVLSGPFAWVGALILCVIGLFILWLTALSWPAVSPTGRLLRLFVVFAFFAGAVFKLMGRI